jgi:hypothetical protein
LFLSSVGWSDKLINILYHLSFQGLFFQVSHYYYYYLIICWLRLLHTLRLFYLNVLG